MVFLLTDHTCKMDVRSCLGMRHAHVHLVSQSQNRPDGSTDYYCTNITYYIMARVLALRWIRVFPTCLLVIAGRVETDHVVMAAAVVTSHYLTTTRWNWVVSRWTMQQ